jgi:amino-acid N-acetyltransferase
MPILIAPAAVEDRDELLRFVARAGLPPDGLGDHLDTTLVARQDGQLIGSAALEIYPRGALLRSVAVDASSRGRGLGQQLTAAAVDLAARSGSPAIYLLTTTAEAFFPRFGFGAISRAEVPDDVKTSVEFRSACPESAVVMRKVLGL